MNRNQWFVLGIGSFIFGWGLWSFAGFCPALAIGENNLLTSCYIQRYAFAIPGMILSGLGVLFIICGFLETRKK